MRAVDTNALVRLITRDDKGRVASAESFVEKGAWVSVLAIAETTWVLSSVFDLDSKQLGQAVEMLLHHRDLVLQDRDTVAAALELFRARPTLGFSDCLMLQLARAAGHLPLGTFDRNLSKVEGSQKLSHRPLPDRPVNSRRTILRTPRGERGICRIQSLSVSMSAQQKAESLGIQFEKLTPGYLNLCVRSGQLLISSGHVSDLKGKLGAGVTTEQGYQGARDCAQKILRSVWNAHGTLDGLRLLKVLGCVNSAQDFIEQHLVINGASDLFHEVFGKDGDGYHARSALGFASLPTGAAVEVEAIFEIKG